MSCCHFESLLSSILFHISTVSEKLMNKKNTLKVLYTDQFWNFADTIAIRIPSEWPFFLLNPWDFKIPFQQVTSLLWFFGQDGDIMPWCRMPIWIVIPLLTAASIENLVTKLETTKFKKSASIDCVHLRTMYP